jgi:hypothetical protein
VNAAQFDSMILRPVLAALHPLIPNSESARRLLLGTAAHESGGFKYIDQITGNPRDPDGPAYGLLGMERITHDDIWDTFLAFRPELAAKVQRFSISGIETVKQMQGNAYYAVVMARMKFYRARPPLPAADDIDLLAEYYKKWYNTAEGKATPQDFKNAVNQFVKGVW